jgi:hypothetical protein
MPTAVPPTKRYWTDPVAPFDDYGDKLAITFIDGATRSGEWRIMTPKSWRKHGVDRLGTGFGQCYEKQPDGRWLKVGG